MNFFLDTGGMSSKWAGCLIVMVLFSIAGFISVYSLGKVLNFFPVLVSEIEDCLLDLLLDLRGQI